MFLFFHVFIALFIFELPFVSKKVNIHPLFLIIGSMWPDILDKSLIFLIEGYYGREFAHSLLGLFIFVGLLYLIERFIIRNEKKYIITKSFLFGCIIHLILDLPHVPLFYPFFDMGLDALDDPIQQWFYTLFHNPLIFITELIGLIGLILIFKHKYIIFNKKMVHWDNLKNYLLALDYPPE